MEYCNISLAIMVQNESKELDNCLSKITSRYKFDEIVILDGGSEDNTIDIAKKYTNKVYQRKFDGNFSIQRNELIKLTTGEWVFMIDADEEVGDEFFRLLDSFIKMYDVDCFALRRKNYIDGELTEVYPDYQLRLFRRYCRWIHAVDEILVGWKRKNEVDIDECDLIHYKTKQKQENQANRYNQIKKDFYADCPYSEIVEWEKNNVK